MSVSTKLKKEIKTKKQRSSRQKNKTLSREKAQQQLIADSEKLLVTKVQSVEYPGGRSRKSCCLVLADNRNVIATRRRSRERAITEHKIMTELAAHEVAIPKVVAFDGRLLLQEKIEGQRLSEALHDAQDYSVEQLLDTALQNLAAIQQAGSACGLERNLPCLGDSQDWIIQLLRRPAVIGRHLGIKPKRPQLDQLVELLQVRDPRFIKWDARPGNALVQENGNVVWFDWEHCGTRNRLDDMVWLLADEYVPNDKDIEERFLKKHIVNFADQLSIDEARAYFYAYGIFHMVMRLALILDNKGKGDWWSLDYCLKGDKVGITLQTAQRLCLRAARWAEKSELTEALQPWFKDLALRLVKL